MSLVDEYFKLTCSHNLWRSFGKSILMLILILIISGMFGLDGGTISILLSTNATFWGVTWIIHLIQHWVLNKKNCNIYMIEEAGSLKRQMNLYS